MVVRLALVFLSKIFLIGAPLDNLQNIYRYICTINRSTTMTSSHSEKKRVHTQIRAHHFWHVHPRKLTWNPKIGDL